jgi:Mn2+/Fe2+ NRAMP family transporter
VLKISTKKGLTKINLTKWRRIIVTRSISIVPCVIVCLLFTDSIIHVNLWCNIIKALQLPFALLPILHFTRSRRIMGAFRNNLFFQLVCYTITFGVLAINIYFLISFIVSFILKKLIIALYC